MTCAGLLAAAATAKLWTTATGLRLLEVPDPVLAVENRYVLLAVAGVELLCATTLLFSRHVWFKALVLLWLGTNFVLYRVALWLAGAGTPCPCLGRLGARLGLSSSQTDWLTKAVVVYLLVVGGFIFIRHCLHSGETGRIERA